MAARIKKIHHDEDTRKRIQVGNIIHRLQQCIMGEIELTGVQVSAAQTLLNKVLPNLTSVDVKSDETKTYVLRAPPPERDGHTWLQKYGPQTIEATPSKPSGLPNPDRKRLS